ncbi:hypothetical protein [Vulcanisaeta distributa]|uniref:hypothetical protein n=1 Tax=Vulcanisaeta distributa TaxID=164451 RepID=UPI0006D29248|nr:hypothetical protein [Vulcanisaeta distributa]
MGIGDKVTELVRKARDAGFLEFYEVNELVRSIIESSSEVNAILYRPGEMPILVNAAKEDDYVSIALLDLNLAEEVGAKDVPQLINGFRDLEDITTRIGFELYGSRSIAPFLYPLYLDETSKVALVVLGIKSAVSNQLFNENFVEELIEDLRFNSDAYIFRIIDALRVSPNK